MKLVIFGATGATGQCLVELALAQGHDVTAFARNPLALTEHEHLSIVRGDMFRPASVEAAVANQDAVLCAIGGHDRLRVALSKQPRQKALCTVGTSNILHAMKQYSLSRLICLSAWGGWGEQRAIPFLLQAYHPSLADERGV